jgi:diamine N-acetyltransferase
MKQIALKDIRTEHFGTLLDNVMKWVNDEEVTFYFARLQRYISFEEETEFLRNIKTSTTDRVFSVWDEDKYIGQVSINKIDWIAGTGRVFCVITPEYQGQGYAIPIIKEIQKYAFFIFNLNKLYLIVRYDNEKGRYIYKRCGFEVEGVLREEYRVGEKYYDMVRMAILKKDYNLWWK